MIQRKVCYDLSDEELERRTDLEKETIAEVKKILKEEFDRMNNFYLLILKEN